MKESTKAIVKKEESIPGTITEQDIDNYLFGSETKLTDSQKMLFKKTCVMHNLNPFKREVYAIPYKDNFNIIIGYEVYLKTAEKSGMLNGWSVKTEGKITDRSLKAVVKIHRKDWVEPLIHEVWFIEYMQENKMWKSKPITMIKKVAIAQAFRLAFPANLGGLPYTADEMPLNDIELKHTEKSNTQEQATDELFDTITDTNKDENIYIDTKIDTALSILGWDEKKFDEYLGFVVKPGINRKKLDYVQKENILSSLNQEIDRKAKQEDVENVTN
jgi:phage recombination protein Bet